MPKVTSVYYQRLETIPGRFANETYGCTVELEPGDQTSSAFIFARTIVNEQHNRTGQGDQDWKGMYERAKVQLENLSANHDNLRRKCEQLQERMSAIAMSIQEETEIPF